MWWIVATLILAGILFLLIETFLLPGVGIFGALSLGAFATACWYSFAYLSPVAGRWVTIGTVILVVLILVLLLRAKTWKRLELKTEVDSKVNVVAESVHPGDRGRALTRLAPIGTGSFGNVNCEAKSFDNKMIDPGTPIEVISIEDGKAIVKPITNE